MNIGDALEQKYRAFRGVITSYSIHYTKLYEILFPSVPNHLRCSFSGILTSNIDLLYFRFLSSIVICRESFLSGAMPIIGFLSILNPIRIRINRPFGLIRQRFQGPVKSVITSYSIHYTKLYEQSSHPLMNWKLFFNCRMS